MSGEFDPSIHIKTVTIISVGGTGAATARIVARIVYDMQRSRRHAPQIVLVDHDRVEEKNIGRQALFAPADVGKCKAEVVGRRLNFALGLDIGWICEPVDASRHFDRYGGNLVISCVDNHEARREIHRISGILVGAGNGVDSGQVSIGSTDDPDLVRRFIDGRDGKYPYLPKEGLLFPELLQPESPRPTPPASCGEMVEPQSLLVNDWMATVIGGYVYKLLHRMPICSFLTYVSSGDFPGVRSVPICREELEVFL
jgi:PRTRC genetic system ThiF family protein